MSPAMDTIASSGLHSPRTTNAPQRQITLSSIPSLTNDSFRLGQPMVSSNSRRRRCSNIDPEVQYLMYSSVYGSSLNSFDYPPPPTHNRYANAQLPPIPANTAAAKANRRLTKVYAHGSDEEDYMVRKASVASLSPPPLPQLSSNVNVTEVVDTDRNSCGNNSNGPANGALALQDPDCLLAMILVHCLVFSNKNHLPASGFQA
ncbi:hypothetical protein BD408DRAFT_418011 [Parasitella parasitica]|nr:hypothetical protein BD408DRAFT_418011 [Parasitella parasitica]